MTLHQIRNYREKDLAPSGMQLEVYEFSSSFLSVAFDFPITSINGHTRFLDPFLKSGHIDGASTGFGSVVDASQSP